MKSKDQIADLRETARRIRRVRKLLGKRLGKRMTQERFARLLGVQPPTVAGWERAEWRYAPGGKMLAKLVKTALEAGSPEDALWFLHRADIDTGVLLSLAVPILQAQRAMPEPGEIFRIDEIEKIPGEGWGLVGREKPYTQRGICLSAQFAQGIQPKSFVLGEEFVGMGLGFPSAGDRLLLDWALGTGEGLELFYEQPVLLEFVEPLPSDAHISLRFGLLHKEPGAGGRSQVVLLEPFGGKLLVGVSDESGSLTLLPGVRVLGRVFGWLRPGQTNGPEKRTEETGEAIGS